MFGRAFMADLARRQQEQRQPSFGMAQELSGVQQPEASLSPLAMASKFIQNRQQEQSNRGLLASQGMLGKGSGRGRGLLGTILGQQQEAQPEQEAIKAPQESQERGMAIMQGKAEAASQISNQAANQAQMKAQDATKAKALAAMSNKKAPTTQSIAAKIFGGKGAKGFMGGFF